MKRQVLPLSDPCAMEVSVVGGKSSGLSRAHNAGLPVLDGFTLAVEASAETLRTAGKMLSERGSGAARLSVIRAEFPEPLIVELNEAAKQLPEPLIVRSSVVLEHDGRWAGAFASLAELRREEVPKAIRSIWAGIFALETLDRFEAAGIKPESALAGALIQPEISPDFGGSASVDRRGIVSVSAVAGSPRDLLAGWVPGVQGSVAANGEISGSEAAALLGDDLLGSVASLTRRVKAELGCNLIEWAVCGDDLVLLQVMETLSRDGGGAEGQDGGGAEGRSGDGVEGRSGAGGRGGGGGRENGNSGGMVLPAALGLPQARELARLVTQYPGSLGEELVLGWLAAWDRSEHADGQRRSALGGAGGENGAGGHLDLLAEARSIASDLTATAWGRPAPEAAATAASALRRLRGDRPNESLEALSTLEAVDPAVGRRLLDILEHLAAALPQPERIWYHTPEELADILSGAEPPRSGRVGRDRWEPFLAGVAALSGEARSGLAASGGVGAGRLSWVAQPSATDHVRPRDVIVVQYPLPNFAPLLWDAAGLIALGGAPSAHLMEVARSLAVPAVVGCPIGDLLGNGGRAKPPDDGASPQAGAETEPHDGASPQARAETEPHDGASPQARAETEKEPAGREEEHMTLHTDGSHAEELHIAAVDGDEGRVAVLQL